jgi:hypothetical protein
MKSVRSPRPDVIQFAPGLPKTRSGKIMRRILRKIGENDVSNLGDTSTLADPSVVDHLLANRSLQGPESAWACAVLIADDHPLFRQALALAVQRVVAARREW